MKELECKLFNFSIKLASNWGGNTVAAIHEQLLQISDYPKIISFFNNSLHKLDFSSHLQAFDARTCVCGAAKKNSYIIHSDGTLYKYTVDGGTSLGCIGIKDADIAEEERAYLELDSIIGECDDCFFSGCCLGISCPKAKKEKERPCPPEKLYIDDFCNYCQTNVFTPFIKFFAGG